MIPAKEFYMIRHGESVANRDRYFSGNLDVALTDLGKQQAEAQLGERPAAVGDGGAHRLVADLRPAVFAQQLIEHHVKIRRRVHQGAVQIKKISLIHVGLPFRR